MTKLVPDLALIIFKAPNLDLISILYCLFHIRMKFLHQSDIAASCNAFMNEKNGVAY
jgi:hypothetical protein